MHTHACVCKPIHQLLLLPHYKDAFKPSTGCDALCVQVLGGQPPGDRVRDRTTGRVHDCTRRCADALFLGICCHLRRSHCERWCRLADVIPRDVVQRGEGQPAAYRSVPWPAFRAALLDRCRCLLCRNSSQHHRLGGQVRVTWHDHASNAEVVRAQPQYWR